MVFLGERSSRRVAAALVLGLLVHALAWAGNACETAGAPQGMEWIRGVPQGCRLVSFDLLPGKTDSPRPGPRVDVVWSYVTSENRHESTVLLSDIDILALELPASLAIDRRILRGTVALTPQQADRLQLAAACGTLGATNTTGNRLRPEESMPTWGIQTIEDRTTAIEAHFAATAADAKRLERPTLATPVNASSSTVRGSIAVPVELQLRR